MKDNAGDMQNDNHDKAIDYLFSIINDNYVLRSIDILSLHGLVLRSIEDDFAGRLRNGGVRISGANFVPPNANKVSDLLDELIDFINTNPLHLNDIELATIFHHKLVWIHPFFDGNGRTVRLSMNLLLMRCGFPPVTVHHHPPFLKDLKMWTTRFTNRFTSSMQSAVVQIDLRRRTVTQS